MINIAICDDDDYEREILYSLTEKYLDMQDVTVEEYSQAYEFLDDISSGKYFDIIFMDISMEGMSGIEAGVVLRNKFEIGSSQIIFVSSHTERVIEVFGARPLDFVQKPILEEKFAEVLHRAIRHVNKNNEIFEYTKGRWDTFRCPYREIRYFTSEGRKIRIGKQKSEDTFNGKLSVVEAILKEQNCIQFIRVNRSNIINIDYITKYSPDYVVIEGRITITLGEKYKRNAYDKIVHYREMISNERNFE